jgi:hypothetical protein
LTVFFDQLSGGVFGVLQTTISRQGREVAVPCVVVSADEEMIHTSCLMIEKEFLGIDQSPNQILKILSASLLGVDRIAAGKQQAYQTVCSFRARPFRW